MKKRAPKKPRQTTLDEFTGGDMLIGPNRPGATIRPDPQQGNLFRDEAQQLHFEIADAPDGRKSTHFRFRLVYIDNRVGNHHTLKLFDDKAELERFQKAAYPDMLIRWEGNDCYIETPPGYDDGV